MKTTLAMLFVTVSALGGIASDRASTRTSLPGGEQAKATAPNIQFAETLYNFGKVKSGEIVSHDFIFTNAGAATLEISDVRPSCGCTTAGTWDKQVEPGKTGIIPLQFNSSAFGGPVTKAATVTCNDPTKSTVVIQLTGTVSKPIDVTPAMPVFVVSSEIQTNETKIVRLLNNMEEPVELSAPQCTNRTFQAQLKTVRAGKEFELHITVVPPFTPPSVVAPIIIQTSSPEMPTISVTTFVVVQPAVTVAPSQITLPPGPLTNTTRSVITIRNTGTNSLVLSDASVNFQGANVLVREIQPGRLFNLSVEFPVGYEVHSGQKIEASVKSNHPKFPVITVPILQSPSAAAAKSE
jgi:hypothetical protein